MNKNKKESPTLEIKRPKTLSKYPRKRDMFIQIASWYGTLDMILVKTFILGVTVHEMVNFFSWLSS